MENYTFCEKNYTKKAILKAYKVTKMKKLQPQFFFLYFQ